MAQQMCSEEKAVGNKLTFYFADLVEKQKAQFEEMQGKFLMTKAELILLQEKYEMLEKKCEMLRIERNIYIDRL